MLVRTLKFAFGVVCLCWMAACGQANQPKPSALPPITAIPGWTLLSNAGVEISVPNTFVGGSNLDVDALAKQLTDLGPEFAQAAQALQQNQAAFLLFAVDTAKGGSGATTNLVVVKEVVRSGMELGSYLDSLASRLPAQTHVLLKEVVALGRYPTARLTAELSTPSGGSVKQVVYVVKNGSAVWQFVFSTPADEFDDRAPVFEAMARTISVPYSTEEVSPSNGGPQAIVFVIGLAVAIGAVVLLAWRRRQRQG